MTAVTGRRTDPMVCPQCSAFNTSDARFCGFCGVALAPFRWPDPLLIETTWPEVSGLETGEGTRTSGSKDD
jgi:ribosomal protein L40E